MFQNTQPMSKWANERPALSGLGEHSHSAAASLSNPRNRPDLRRKDARRRAEQLLAASQYLPPADRVLIELVFRDGRPAADVATVCRLQCVGDKSRSVGPSSVPATGTSVTLPTTSPARVRARVRRLARRLASPEFIFVVHHRAGWSTTRRNVASALWIEGLSMRATAQALNLSLHTVRRHREAVLAQFESITSPART
ncbi:MAG: hypothetical protein SFZ23_00240 [Planctomycetota bacterium]|nr:hypothetical protein [Planctomycetota bacterium]